MVKKIGSLFLWFILLQISIVCADQTKVSLSVLDHNGRSSKEVALGVPFIIEVTVQGDDAKGMPQIDRMTQLHIKDQSMSTMRTTINGVTTHKKIYRYIVRADKEGVFTIGPAKVQTSQGTVASTLATITVAAQTNSAQQTQEAFVKLIAEPDRPVVGQKVMLRIRFYYQSGTSLTGVSEPQLPNGSQQLEGPFSGDEIVNGLRMHYLEWHTYFYPKNSGTVIIPAVRATYRIEAQARRGFDIFSFFDNAMEQKYVYSNALSVSVDELPAYHEPVTIVGVLDKAQLSMDREKVIVGDGAVIKLMLEGFANFDTMATPILALPKGLTYYESTARTERIGNDRERKIFEYIVQGQESGIFTIPPQEIPYFNIETRRYERVKTTPLTLEIMGRPTERTESDKMVDATNKWEPEPETHEFKMPLTTTGSISKTAEWYIDWSIFLFIVALFILCEILYIAWRSYKKYRNAHTAYYQSHYAFTKALKALKNRSALTDRKSMYDTFVTLFAERTDRGMNEINEDLITAILLERDFPAERIKEWNSFFKQLTEYAFFSAMYDSQYAQTLNARALSWLEELKKYI